MATFDRKEDYLYIRWAKEIKNRDFHCCQICGTVGGNLNAHHLNGWNAYPDQRYDIDNGVTLCNGCHERFHQIYGKGGNTEEQFNEFEKLFNIINKVHIKKNKIKRYREIVKEKIKDRDGYL